MSNAIFPSLIGLAWPVLKRPMWRTKIHPNVSGKEVRTAMMNAPLWQFELQYEVLRSDALLQDYQTLLGFYNQRSGAFDSWLFNDITDNSVVDSAFGTGDGTTVAFQLTRALGGAIEPIQNVNVLTNIKDNGSVVSGANYTVGSTGIVTFTTPPVTGHSLTWTGTFYYRCRFLDDSYDFEEFMVNVWQLGKISFQSIKL